MKFTLILNSDMLVTRKSRSRANSNFNLYIEKNLYFRKSGAPHDSVPHLIHLLSYLLLGLSQTKPFQYVDRLHRVSFVQVFHLGLCRCWSDYKGDYVGDYKSDDKVDLVKQGEDYRLQ